MDNSLCDEIRRLNFEDLLWVLFVFLSIMNIISNSFQKELVVFFLLLVLYVYYIFKLIVKIILFVNFCYSLIMIFTFYYKLYIIVFER